MKSNWSRRDFLKNTSGATLAALAAGAPLTSLLQSCNNKSIANTSADTVILLWMAGGMAHTDTFDPKKYTAFEKGMNANSVLSTFKPVPNSTGQCVFFGRPGVHWQINE